MRAWLAGKVHAVVDDSIDEVMETVDVSVKQLSGDVLTANFGTGKVFLADNDAPVLTTGATSVGYDRGSDVYYLLKAIDINNRAGQAPDIILDAAGSVTLYKSASQRSNSANDQAFTTTLRFKGEWEVAIVNTALDSSISPDYAGSYSGLNHSSTTKFLSLNGTAEMLNGQATGYTLADLAVPAGSYQIMMPALTWLLPATRHLLHG